MELKDLVRQALRISSDAYDEGEIGMLIAAAIEDLLSVGVSATVANGIAPSPLALKAIVTYCKAEFGYDNPEAGALRASYRDIKNELRYKYRAGDGDAG